MTTLDINFVRSQFPAFAEPALQGQAFFENAGGSYTCQQVIDRLTRFYRQRKVQPYAPYAASTLGGEEMDEARTRLAALLGVSEEELSFGPSTTQNTYILSNAYAQFLKPGDVIVVTNQDHEANTGPWRRLAEIGIEVREWQVDAETGHLDIADLPNLLDGAKLLCFPHCSNIVGEINPVAEICALARTAGVRTCVDGVSYAPHGLPNVGKLGCDIYLFSTYKTYGPHQGLMVMRRDLAEELPNQGHYFNAADPTKRFTPAGPDHAQVAACAGIADYTDALYTHHVADDADATARGEVAHDLMRDREIRLLQPVLDYLRDKNSIRLLGPTQAELKAPTVAMVSQTPGNELAKQLAPLGIMTGGGDFYGVRCLKAQGVDPDHGALRVSFVHYTSEEEVAKLIDALDQVL